MRRAIMLLAGAALLSGCTPKQLGEWLFPTCNSKTTNCNMPDPTPDPPDTTHWTRGPYWGPPHDTTSLAKLPNDSTR
jgi:hypothetical protein